jgi:D-arginine dehydrogenase
VIVIAGGGIAGASLASALARRGVRDVVLLEREQQHGVHATGRSAAVLVQFDLLPVLMQLKIAAAPMLRERGVLHPNGILLLFDDPVWSVLRGLPQAIGGADAQKIVPALRAEAFAGALWLPEDGHLDVEGLLQAYLREARAGEVQVRTGAAVAGVTVERGRVRVVTTSAGETLECEWLVDAAGAGAGELAQMAGALPIEITPRRRCIATFAAPVDVSRWPLVAHETKHVYFAPESGGLLVSPMDEVAMAPCDVRPDEEALAVAVERLRDIAPSLAPRTFRRKWAGLRTFAPDRVPVVGRDPQLDGFFWLAGQGGCGIETSPIMAEIAADLLTSGRCERFDARALLPERFLR